MEKGLKVDFYYSSVDCNIRDLIPPVFLCVQIATFQKTAQHQLLAVLQKFVPPRGLCSEPHPSLDSGENML